MYTGLHVKYPLFLPGFNKTRLFPDRFSGSTQIPNFMKIRSAGAQAVPCGLADTRTEKYEEANSRFSQFCERA